MLRYIEEFKRHVAITGFRGVEIRNIEEFFRAVHREKSPNVDTQFFDAAHIATWQHLYFAALNALTAFENNENFSNSLTMEMLLYASAQHQINNAMKLVGISPDSREIAVLIIGEDRDAVNSTFKTVSKLVAAESDDSVLKLIDSKGKTVKEIFGISDTEIKTVSKNAGLEEESLVNLVIERMALLATQR
jgi:tRNA threonylcarbamoyladenosine modification (KEOPS) complex Cgi121 subunit